MLKNDVLAHQSTVETVNKAGNELLESSARDEASSLRHRLAAMNSCWESVLQKTEEREQQLQTTLQQVGCREPDEGAGLSCPTWVALGLQSPWFPASRSAQPAALGSLHFACPKRGGCLATAVPWAALGDSEMPFGRTAQHFGLGGPALLRLSKLNPAKDRVVPCTLYGEGLACYFLH